MISIGSKNKILLFDVSTKGIDSENLEFWFRIQNENISYSFKGELLDKNKVKIVVLPLIEMVNTKYLDTAKVYPAKLEVIGDGKYSLVPWEGEIKLETPPRIDVKLENVREEVKKIAKKDVKKPENIIKEETPPEKIEVSVIKVVDENTETNKDKDSSVEPEKKSTPVAKSVVKESDYDEDLEKIEYTRTSLLEDILGASKKKPNVVTKINDLIKE